MNASPLFPFSTKIAPREVNYFSGLLSFEPSTVNAYKIQLPIVVCILDMHRMLLDIYFGRSCFDRDTSYYFDLQHCMDRRTSMTLCFGKHSSLPLSWGQDTHISPGLERKEETSRMPLTFDRSRGHK